jgi:AraC-like DNA-binding protein
MTAWERQLPPPRHSDKDGEVSHGNAGRESIYWVFPFPAKWPLFIQHSGSSLWREGNFFRRRKFARVAAEIVTAGDLHFIQNKREYIVRPGQAFILQKGSDHVYATGPAKFICKRFVALEGPGLDSILSISGLNRIDVITLENPGALISIMKKAQRLLRAKPAGFEKLLSAYAYEIVNELIASSAPRRSAPVQKAMEILQHDLGRSFTNRQLAREIGVSAPFLISRFRAETGHTPLRYRTQARITLARHLLRDTDMSVKEISQNAGFEDQLYFSRLFKKIAGIAPRQFRSAAR